MKVKAMIDLPEIAEEVLGSSERETCSPNQEGGMSRWRKKPVEIEAFQMTLERRWDNSEWPNWLNEAWNREPSEGAVWIDGDDPKRERLVCGTLEGVHRIDWDDWIIRGVKGELYPCKPDIFEATYEPAQCEKEARCE